MNLLPITSGEYPAEVPSDFLNAVAERVREGLFPMAPATRNNYEVVSQDRDALRFRSTSVWTGINVGLNDVCVMIDKESGHARFEIKYWTWAKYAIGLSAVICGTTALIFTVGRSFLPPFWFRDVDQSPAFVWTMLVFWGLIWPWILIAMHKPSVRKCLIRIFDEVNEHGSKSQDAC